MDLAEPPMLQYLLLEQPWPAMIIAVAVAAVCWVVAQRRGKPRLRLVSGAALLAAGGIYLAATLITTEREQVLAETHRLIAATEQTGHMTTLRAVLAPQATLSGPDGSRWLNLSAMLDELHRVLQRHTVTEHSISQLAAEVGAEGQARSAFRLRTELGSQPGMPFPTSWRLTWRKNATGQWQVVDVQWVEYLHGQTPHEGIWRQ